MYLEKKFFPVIAIEKSEVPTHAPLLMLINGFFGHVSGFFVRRYFFTNN